jgi:hypothetical protein
MNYRKWGLLDPDLAFQLDRLKGLTWFWLGDALLATLDDVSDETL